MLVPIGVMAAFLAVALFCRRRFQVEREDQIAANDQRTGFIIQLLDRMHPVKAISTEARSFPEASKR